MTVLEIAYNFRKKGLESEWNLREKELVRHHTPEATARDLVALTCPTLIRTGVNWIWVNNQERVAAIGQRCKEYT